ncbi:hypothetical protein QNH20_02410 [Neobacillus sp. WH10]|uniref:hypothetical protein n=1 Tax=Neobacillus sp. WH10 TaxID=3047873 RepID=UPI0024C0F27C|nr:hypothetical protein [Neobacillus sp. WH10]WHY78042.1 hypothetical protein QNH20_02410 [Neobacillus sp. WH10]
MIAGLLIGYGLFMATSADILKLGIALTLVGVSHGILSLWGYRKFVGKGILSIK